MRIMRFLFIVTALAVILSLSAFAAAPVITSQPQNVYFPVNQEFPVTVYFSIMATGDNLSYQWQLSRDNGESWSDIDTAAAVTSTCSAYVTSSNVGTRLYRCIVSCSEGETISEVVSVSVGSYLMDSIPQMLVCGSEIINSIFVWVGSACSSIIGTPLLLIGVSFFALGAAIAILSRLLFRS